MATESTLSDVKQAFDPAVTNSSDSFFIGLYETIVRNLKIIWRYKFKLVNRFINTLIVYTLYFFVSKLVPGSVITDEYYMISSTSFFFCGAIIVETASKILASGLGSFQSEMRQGTFESLVTSSFGLKKYVYAEIIAETLYTLFISILFFIPILFIFPLFNDVSLTLLSALSMAVILLFMLTFITTLSLVGANFTILIKRGREIAMVFIGLLLLLSGILFPLDVFPNWLQTVALASPLTHAVYAFRVSLFAQGTLSHPVIVKALIVLSIASIILWILFHWSFKKIYQRVQKTGTFSEY